MCSSVMSSPTLSGVGLDLSSSVSSSETKAPAALISASCAAHIARWTLSVGGLMDGLDISSNFERRIGELERW